MNTEFVHSQSLVGENSFSKFAFEEEMWTNKL